MTMIHLPVVQRARKTMTGDYGSPVECEVELRVTRQRSALLTRQLGTGEWKSWVSWPTATLDPVGAAEREAARYGVSGWQPVPPAPLTVADVVSLHAIVDAAARGARVARVADTGDEPVRGTARHIVTDDQGAAFPNASDDVRDCLLRVTLASGMEAFWPVTDLVRDHQAGMFVTDYDPPIWQEPIRMQ